MIDTDIKEALVVCLSRHGDSPESGIAAAEVLLGIAIGLARNHRRHGAGLDGAGTGF